MSNDPIDCLTEIAKLAMDRANSGDVTANEMFTLGEITGIAWRVPAVGRRLKEMEDEAKGLTP